MPSPFSLAAAAALTVALSGCALHGPKQTPAKEKPGARLGQLVADQAVPVAAIVGGEDATVACDGAQTCVFSAGGKAIGQIIADRAAAVAAIIAGKTARVSCLSGITVTCDFKAK